MRGRGALVGLAALVGLGALAGCGNHTDYVVVEVFARDAVHGAQTIAVTLGNAGTTRTDNLMMNGRGFPVTFSISAPGRTGELTISVDAIDDNQLVVARGASTTTLDADTANVLLDPMDFVVNTDFAGDQFPSNDFEAAGFQLAALPDGTWTTAFRDNCPTGSCSLFARRFDLRGQPVSTQAAAGTNAFALNTSPISRDSSQPAIASSQTATIAAWDLDTGSATMSSVACRAIGSDGALGPDQVAVATDPMESADVVSAAAMAGGNFVITWKTILPTGLDAIRMATVTPTCALVGTVQTVASGPAVADLLHRGSVAAGANHVLFAWITNGDLHTRLASAAGALSAAEVTLVPQTATEQVEHARVVAVPGGGFAIAVRWTAKATSTGTSHIDLFRVSDSGALVGTPVRVTDQSGNDFDSRESFGIASRSDATKAPADVTVLVVWHTCGGLADDSLCGVFGRLLRHDPVSDGFATVGDRFVIPTTTTGDQRLPSVSALPDSYVAVWSDASAAKPDQAGLAVRARIVYPPGM
jgi:hypothetical protein